MVYTYSPMDYLDLPTHEILMINYHLFTYLLMMKNLHGSYWGGVPRLGDTYGLLMKPHKAYLNGYKKYLLG
jgi:hypothetical protein